MARLDRLNTAKEIAQLGATLGREFSYELIQTVSPLDEEALRKALTRLVEAEVLYQRGVPPQAHYVFKHALIQDAAYQSLLKSTRQRVHQQIAQTLEERFAEIRETQPELLAHHYTEAGLIGQALPYWQQAGERATQRSANAEAIGYLTKGLTVLDTLPDTLERAQAKLKLQLSLGVSLAATKGYGAPDVEQAYTQARELCLQVKESPESFWVLGGLGRFYALRGEFLTARDLSDQCLRLSQISQDPNCFLFAHYMSGAVVFWLGELELARSHLEQGVALHPSLRDQTYRVFQGENPKVGCLCYLALALWVLGYPDQASRRSYEALTLARELAHPFSLAYCLGTLAQFHCFRREGQLTREHGEAAIALASDLGFPFWIATGGIVVGWASTEQGQLEEGIAQMRRGIEARLATGVEIGRPHFLALLADVYGKMGRLEEGLILLAEALAAADKTGECWYEAELYRLKGTLTLQSKTSLGQVSSKSQASQDQSEVPDPRPLAPDPQAEAEAEAYFLKAIEIARRQSAKSLELRAVMSLSRLWQQQGRQEEARQMLAEIYSWFTEGFDTVDLQEAKALLEELRH